jgi:hypothetical protein
VPTLSQVAVVLTLFLAQALVPPFGALVMGSVWLGHAPAFPWILGIALVSVGASLPLLYGRPACLPAWGIAAASLLVSVVWLASARFAGMGETLFVAGTAALGAAGAMARRSRHLQTFLEQARDRRSAGKSADPA